MLSVGTFNYSSENPIAGLFSDFTSEEDNEESSSIEDYWKILLLAAIMNELIFSINIFRNNFFFSIVNFEVIFTLDLKNFLLLITNMKGMKVKII